MFYTTVAPAHGSSANSGGKLDGYSFSETSETRIPLRQPLSRVVVYRHPLSSLIYRPMAWQMDWTNATDKYQLYQTDAIDINFCSKLR